MSNSYKQQKAPGLRPRRDVPPMALPVEKPHDFKRSLFRLLQYLKPHLLSLSFVIFAAISGTVFTILSPRLIGRVTTIIFTGMLDRLNQVSGAGIDFSRIGKILLLLVGLYLASSLFRYLEFFIMASVSQRMVYDLRNKVRTKLTRLPLKYYDSHPHGDILSRVTNDMDLIGSTLQQSMTQIIEAIVTLTGILIMMATINRWLTLITLVTLPLSFYVTAQVTRHSQKQFAAQQEELGALNGHVEEMYGGHLIVKAFNYEKESLARFQTINQRLYEAGWKAQFMSGIIMPLLGFINNIGYMLIAIVGSIFVTQGTIALGDVQAFFQYSRQFTHPIVQTANIANILQSTIAAAERVFKLLDEEEEIADAEKALNHFAPRGDVRFEHVYFGYSSDNMLIKDLNIDIHAGQTVAIVGPTGAGKTTLVNLLLRFYDVNRGRITIDGVDIRNIKRSVLRNIFGMVLQDTWLFTGTIKDNIAFGRANATTKEIIRAAEAAQVDHFIRTLSQGYDTVINQDASNLSQGQKQLITIARAILADSPILILDEATSNVDTRTEILIQRATAQLMKGRTSFVIAHRLSTIRTADLILVMNNGEVVEQGTHTQLLAQDGFYADIYKSQFSTTQAG
ncbi:MAG: ABC transporter ATP-binding protein [bacterium]|jgi:ATP-binding cassette subfamily B multidrug efflux pump